MSWKSFGHLSTDTRDARRGKKKQLAAKMLKVEGTEEVEDPDVSGYQAQKPTLSLSTLQGYKSALKAYWRDMPVLQHSPDEHNGSDSVTISEMDTSAVNFVDFDNVSCRALQHLLCHLRVMSVVCRCATVSDVPALDHTEDLTIPPFTSLHFKLMIVFNLSLCLFRPLLFELGGILPATRHTGMCHVLLPFSFAQSTRTPAYK
eukprot:764173-Hanusia_phi.AAC.4